MANATKPAPAGSITPIPTVPPIVGEPNGAAARAAAAQAKLRALARHLARLAAEEALRASISPALPVEPERKHEVE